MILFEKLKNTPLVLKLLYLSIFVVAGILLVKVWTIQSTYHELYNPAFESYILSPDLQDGEKPEHIIIEFMDYRCSFCRAIHPVMQDVLERSPKTKLIIRHYPIFGEPSIFEGKLALAAAQQGQFHAIHHFLASNDKPFKPEMLPLLEKEYGLDLQKIDAFLNDQNVNDHFLRTLDAAETLNINSTPTFIIGRTVFVPKNGMPTTEDILSLLGSGQKDTSKE